MPATKKGRMVAPVNARPLCLTDVPCRVAVSPRTDALPTLGVGVLVICSPRTPLPGPGGWLDPDPGGVATVVLDVLELVLEPPA